jgi:hypothetical protein
VDSCICLLLLHDAVRRIAEKAIINSLIFFMVTLVYSEHIRTNDFSSFIILRIYQSKRLRQCSILNKNPTSVKALILL